METTFQFVNGPAVDRSTRRLIRSHVMKGKNAGKTVQRASKLALAKPRTFAPTAQEERTVRRWTQTSIHRKLCNDWFTVPFPIELSLSSRRILAVYMTHVVEMLYPVSFNVAAHEAKSIWLDILFTDAATTHCCMALMSACNEFFTSEPPCLPTALYHQSQALALMRQRLAHEDALSDATLSFVLMLVTQEQFRNEHDEAKVHHQGLQRMVQLRGGLTRLENNKYIMLKICQTDILFALQYGEPILFFQDQMIQTRLYLEARGFHIIQGEDALARHHSLHCDLDAIVKDVVSFTDLLNISQDGLQLDILSYQAMLISICGRLIQFHPLKSSNEISSLDATYHIGLIIYIMTLFLKYGERRTIESKLVTKRLQEVLGRRDDLDERLLLWVMFVGGIWAFGRTDEAWLVPMIRETLQRKGLESWRDVREYITVFPWVDVAHDYDGSRLCKRALGTS